MQRRRWRLVARVVKTHGKKGEVVVTPVHGLPALLSEGMQVACVPPLLSRDRFHRVTGVQTEGGAGELVSLTGVSDLNDARGLVGASILVPADELPDEVELKGPEAWIGRIVHDRRSGDLGEINEVMVGRGNDVWVVDGPYGEVLVPVVDEFIVDAPEDGPIEVDLPDGLVEG